MIESDEEEKEEGKEGREEERREMRPFFDCEEDKTATCKQDFIDAQTDMESKCMNYIRENLDERRNRILYTKQNGMYVARKDEEEMGKIIVPECLRAHILKTFHNSDLAGHQGEKRTFLQIRETFFWPGMKNQVSKWVKACLA